MKIEAIIFDMDGVLIDSERQSNEGWLWAAQQKQVTMPMWLIDSFKGAQAAVSCQFFDEYFHGTQDYYEMRELRTQYVYQLREKEGIPVKSGVDELFAYIRKTGLKCAVATSTNRNSAEKTLHNIGVWDTLDGVMYGDQIEHGKPEPDIFLAAAEMIGVAPQNCIVIEDSINGIKAGYRAGMKVIHIPDTIVIDEETKKMTYRIFNRLDEMIPFLEGLR